ncbi:LOW QUALITY PROTEIN: RNA binding motif protein 12Ba [Spinachia spinachia]
MTIILRLEGLDVMAGTEDIRTFFAGLHIPDGGVYIVGGSLSEAFIAFTVYRDAQLAMRYTEKFLKGSKVTLHISSMAELEQKLKSSLKKKKPSSMQPAVKSPVLTADAHALPLTAHPLQPNTANSPTPLNLDIANLPLLNAHSLDSNTAFLLGICTVLQGLHSTAVSENSATVARGDFPKAGGMATCDVAKQKPTQDSSSGYVRLFGLPGTTTKEDICQFFKGLTVQEVIVNVELGRSHVCLAKFANTQDSCSALFFNQRSLGPICVEVRGATEKMWTSAMQECKSALEVGRATPKQRPPGGAVNHKQDATSALTRELYQLPYESPKRPKSTRLNLEHVVMVTNLPQIMTKTEIKELFGCPNIAHKNVQHLLDKEGNRTDIAFLIFNRMEDYEYAINLNGCHISSNAIEVSSIGKEMMWEMVAKTRPRKLKQCQNTGSKNGPNRESESNLWEKPVERPITDPAAKTCLLVRNMPADVKKRHIKRLFGDYKVSEENIISLHDRDGNGIGEAVVQFQSQKFAALAQRLHGQNFLGTKVLLTLINETQVEDILTRSVPES